MLAGFSGLKAQSAIDYPKFDTMHCVIGVESSSRKRLAKRESTGLRTPEFGSRIPS
jgi:hypothetical protein